MTSSARLAQDIYDAITNNPETMVWVRGVDGCWWNSHVAAKTIAEFGVPPEEIIFERLSATQGPYGLETFRDFFVPTAPVGQSYADLGLSWRAHVAAATVIDGQSLVFDPLLFDGPVSEQVYLNIFPAFVTRRYHFSALQTFAEDKLQPMLYAFMHHRSLGYMVPPNNLKLNDFIELKLKDRRHPGDGVALLEARKNAQPVHPTEYTKVSLAPAVTRAAPMP